MKNASLEILHATERFENLGGLDRLKEFALKIAGSPLARGLLLLGVPGCGKSHFAKTLCGELSIPTLSLEFGRLFGSLVGESEERMRQALSVADAMVPSILMLDEIDKGLSGATSSHQSDGGVGSKKYKVSWMEYHENILWADDEEEAIETTQVLFDPRETLLMDQSESGTWLAEELSADSSIEPTQHIEVERKEQP